MNELISIIVPAYNVEEYIEKCVDSILGQTYRAWELFIIDDGSTDSTGDIADRYSYDHENITVIHQANLGISSARNRGIDIARGSYILFADADDWMEKDMLQVMTEEGQHADMIVCGINNCFLRENGEIIRKPRKLWAQQQAFLAGDIYYDVLCRTGTIWNKLIRAECIGSIRFDPAMVYGEDTNFLARILANVRSAAVVPRCMYNYLKNRDGNVVSAKIDFRSLQLLDNMLKTYRLLKPDNKGIYGVCRIEIAVNEVMAKIKDLDDRSNRRYIRRCGYVLRKVGFKDRALYLISPLFKTTFRKKLRFLFLTYFTKQAVKRRRKNAG